MTNERTDALLRRLATNRDTFTEWVISREETQDILDLVAERANELNYMVGKVNSLRALAEARGDEIFRLRAADPYLHTTLHGVKVKVLLDNPAAERGDG